MPYDVSSGGAEVAPHHARRRHISAQLMFERLMVTHFSSRPSRASIRRTSEWLSDVTGNFALCPFESLAGTFVRAVALD